MKKRIIKMQLTTLCLYAIVYLIKTFILWKFTNPFWWIINLPNYDLSERAMILTGWASYYCVWIPYIFVDEKKN